jgi:hypothetical protein
MLWNFKSPFDATIHKWSMARQEAWDDCQRKYYYQYKGAAKASKHPLKDQISKLKQKRTLAHLKGELVHAALSDFIRSNNGGTPEEIATLCDKRWAKMMAKPEETLIDFTNGRGLALPLIEQARMDCQRLLENFVEMWPEYANDEILFIDDPDDHPGWFNCGGLGVYGRPHLILKRDKYTIVNWKTGEEPDDFSENIYEMSTSIYIACFDYMGNIRAYPEEFEGIFQYLPTKSKSKIITRNQNDYEQFIESVEEIISDLPDSYMEERFIPDPAKWKCKNCNYATVCHDGRQLLEL